MRHILFIATMVLALGSTSLSAQPAPQAPLRMAQIPKDKDHDLKLYQTDGRIVQGAEAMARMKTDAKLILWVAGNQFFAMDHVVHEFQKKNPEISVGLITLPPGLLVDAILGGGWIFEGKEYPGLPDVYASVNLGHLKRLNVAGLMDQYAIYMHNELEIMVAKGNPKKISGMADLVRADIRTSMPNPINEGIMQFYARKVLERHGLWLKISDGKECMSCQTTPNNWFTAVHHRETPERLKSGLSDAGIVWKTETLEALRDGAAVESVALPPQDSLREEVSYAIGVLKVSHRAEAAARYLDFLSTSVGQSAYTSFGFVGATPKELALKRIP